MALILKDGSVFLHIPKTGGNWVSKVLSELKLVDTRIGQNKHVDQSRLLVPLGKGGVRWLGPISKWKLRSRLEPRPFIFCFVRHPLSWYESWFHYMSQPTHKWRNYGEEDSLFDWHACSVLNGCGSNDFNEFVSNAMNKCPGFVSHLYQSYTLPKIDFVGKQETLREDLITLFKIRGFEFDETLVRNSKRAGVSRKRTESLEWDPALREKLVRLEAPALRSFGYEA